MSVETEQHKEIEAAQKAILLPVAVGLSGAAILGAVGLVALRSMDRDYKKCMEDSGVELKESVIEAVVNRGREWMINIRESYQGVKQEIEEMKRFEAFMEMTFPCSSMDKPTLVSSEYDKPV